MNTNRVARLLQAAFFFVSKVKKGFARMVNNFIKALLTYWNKIDPAWRSAAIVFLAGRLFYTLWSLIILYLFPTAIFNADLFGTPALLAFDMRLEKGYVYSREANGTILTFEYLSPGQVTDTSTHSTWSLENGIAIEGKFAGISLHKTVYAAEDVFPYVGVQSNLNPPLALWQRYDTNWYLTIAQNGYHANDGTMAFFPLYPLLIWFLGSILRNDLLAALLISNFTLFLGMYFLFALTDDIFGQPAAQRTLIYLLIFPTSFFFFAAYTEAPFFLCATAAFYAAHHHRWGLTGFLGALAALTRMQGILLIIPLGYIWFRDVWQKKRSIQPALLLLLIPLAFLSFQIFTGGKSATSLELHWHARTAMPWENIWLVIRSFFDGKGNLIAGFNLIVAVGFLLMCIPISKYLPLEYSLYAILVLLIPLFRINENEPLVSYGRYALAAFPVFMVWGRWGKNPWINRLVIYIGLPLMLYFCAKFLLWSWVG